MLLFCYIRKLFKASENKRWMGKKLKITLKTTLEDFVGKGGWRNEERREKISEPRKQLESRIYHRVWEAGYLHRTLGEFKKYAERCSYGLGSLGDLDKKSIYYFNNELKRHGIEPIIPRLNKMDEKTLSHVQHWNNYRLYGGDYLKYNGLKKNDIYKRN